MDTGRKPGGRGGKPGGTEETGRTGDWETMTGKETGGTGGRGGEVWE